ncbi:MAG: energy-coupling factor transporter transmembrane component T [bacterium]
MQIFRDFTLGRYFSADSALHRLDPRTKLICTLAFLLLVFGMEEPVEVGSFFILIMALFLWAKIPFRMLWGNIRIFLWLYALTFLLHLFLHPGEALWRVPLLGLTITSEGIAAGILFTVRIAVIISLSNLLMAITMPQDLTDGMEKLLKPLTRFRIPVSEGALMVSIALRFVPILIQEADKIQKAQLARGADLEGAFFLRLRKFIPILLPLFSGALKKADVLALALEARAYRGGEGRTRMVSLAYRMGDLLAFGAVIAVSIPYLLW